MSADPMAPPAPGVSTPVRTGGDRAGHRPASTAPRRRRPGHLAIWLPRNLHPVAWWLWALGLVVAASRTTNPLLLALVLAAAGFVVMRRRGTAPWARAFRYYLIFGAVIIVIRVATRVIFGGANTVGDHLLFTLPQVPLPGWAAGISIGGPVMAESVLAAAYEGFRLATIIACIGAANALANPKRALRVLPGALYELGVAVVISITVVPQLITGIQRVRRARRLRGDTRRGLRSIGAVALPVLQDALDRSLALAAAMDSRGYGRRPAVSEGRRRSTVALLLAGLCALAIGVYGLLGGGASSKIVLPATIAGAVLCGVGLAVGSRRVHHTDHAPDPWDIPETLVVIAGAMCAVVFVVVTRFDVADLDPSLNPLRWPDLPLIPALAVLVAATPAFTAPRPPTARVPGRSRAVRRDLHR